MPELPLDGPCYMRSLQGIAETYAGRNLTADDIKDAINDLVPDKMNSSFFVLDGPAVIEDALTRLGVDTSGLGIQVVRPGDPNYEWAKANATASLRAVGRVDEPQTTSPKHTQEGDSQGYFVFDPISGDDPKGRKNSPDQTRYVIIRQRENGE